MGRTRTGRPPGRPMTVLPKEPTDAERRLMAAAILLWEEDRKWPSVTAVANRTEWTRQRAHALAKRLVDKGLAAMVPDRGGLVRIEVLNYQPRKDP